MCDSSQDLLEKYFKTNVMVKAEKGGMVLQPPASTSFEFFNISESTNFPEEHALSESDCKKEFPLKSINVKIKNSDSAEFSTANDVKCKPSEVLENETDDEEDDNGSLDNVCNENDDTIENVDEEEDEEDEEEQLDDDVERIESSTNKDDREKKLQCNICGKRFIKLGNLRRHASSCDPNSDAAQREKAKNKRYSTKREYPYLCIRCGKRFSKGSGLKHHKKLEKCVAKIVSEFLLCVVLTNLVFYQLFQNPECRFCKYNFKNISELETHLRERHPPERPHMCLICLKTFKSVSNRNTHQQSHNDSRCRFFFCLFETIFLPIL